MSGHESEKLSDKQRSDKHRSDMNRSPDRSLTGTDLAAVVESPGPFATLFVSVGASVEARARVAIDEVPVPDPHAGLLMDALEPDGLQSQVVIVAGDGAVTSVMVDDPFTADVVRFGDVPSLGPLLELRQMVASHAVVTVENDAFAVTSFGTVGNDDEQYAVFEAVDHLIDHLRSIKPRMVALVGAESALDSYLDLLRNGLAGARLTAYSTDDIDRDLASLADRIVRDAATLAAELRTHELAHFRQARLAGQAVEGPAVLGALEQGTVQRVLVHDAVEASPDGSSRLVDRVVATAIGRDVPVTMIPMTPTERGPRGGIGGILEGDGAAVETASEPRHLDEAARAHVRTSL